MNQTTHSPFIIYPKQAAFGRVLPKNKIYEHSDARPAVREMVVRQVEQIVWQFKLAPETINLASKPSVPEIQIFSIQLKTPTLNHDVLRCIDGAVQFPIIFELSFESKTQVVAAFKRPSESDSNRWVVSEYFASAWQQSDIVRFAMPLTLDLGGLYEQLLYRLIPLAVRPQECLTDLVGRVELADSKRREVEKAAIKLAKEKQFNRKVEINATLKQLQIELEYLSR